MNYDFPPPRLEGRNGLLIAKNANGEAIPADAALPGEKYTCMFCGIEMHLTHTKYKEAIFARNSGVVHTDLRCKALEKSETKNIVLLENPEDFIEGLCCPVVPAGPRFPGFGGGGSAPGNGPGNGPVEMPSQLKNLEQIFMAGIHLMPPEENSFGFVVGDLVLSYVWLNRFLNESDSELGSKIVHVVFVPRKGGCYQYQNILLFKMFSKNKSRSGQDHIYFRLCFNNGNDRTRIRKKFTREQKNGEKTVTKGREGLIACDCWEKIYKPDCQSYCGTVDNEYCARCGGLYSGRFSSNNQVYAVPERFRKKKNQA